MSIVFQCGCGARLQARDDQAGIHVTCPRCQKMLLVPGPRGAGGAAPGPPGWPILPTILIAAAVPILLVTLVPIMLGVGPRVVAGLLLGMLLIPVGLFFYVLNARNQAFREHAREVDLFFGFVKLILWEPTEGIVLLRNKRIDFVDNQTIDGGGVKFIYPVMGQELGLRVPLTILPVEFRNSEVYTRDSIPLFMRLTIWWKVNDLRKYYLSISREVHLADENSVRQMRPAAGDSEEGATTRSARQQLGAAERWITMTAEEETRAFVSQISTSLLVAEQIMAALPKGPTQDDEIELEQPRRPAGGSDNDSLGMYQTATNMLAERLYPRLNEKLAEKGLYVDRVALQEVRLPEDIHQKAVDAAKAWYGLLEAQRQGRGEAARYEELARVLGKDAVAMGEVLKNAHGMTFFQFPQFLDQLFARSLGGPQAAARQSITSGTSGESARLP